MSSRALRRLQEQKQGEIFVDETCVDDEINIVTKKNKKGKEKPANLFHLVSHSIFVVFVFLSIDVLI